MAKTRATKTYQRNQGLKCAVSGCARDATTKGWCHMHYLRVRRNGKPGPPKPKAKRPGGGAWTPRSKATVLARALGELAALGSTFASRTISIARCRIGNQRGSLEVANRRLAAWRARGWLAEVPIEQKGLRAWKLTDLGRQAIALAPAEPEE